MATTQIKDKNDNELKVNTDGSINTVSSTTIAGPISIQETGFSALSPGYPTQVAVGVTSMELLPANPSRRYAHIFNNTNNFIFIQFEATAALNQGIKINPGNYFTLSGDDLWLGAVNAIALIPGQLIDVLEGI